MHKLKGSVGPFKIYNVGKMAYSIERGGIEYATAKNISDAYRAAERLNDQSKTAVDTALALGNGDCR